MTGSRLLIRHPAGDVDVPVGVDLESQPSRIWAAIGNAIAEDAAPFRHIHLETVDGVPVAFDPRPPLIEPTEAHRSTSVR